MRLIVTGAALLALLSGCSPDAPHDNPYDVPQTGVYGTTYGRTGPLAGVSVSSSPANITTTSDGQGNYSLALTGGSHQVLQFAKADHQSDTKAIDVPDRGLVQQNAILNGLPVADTALVKTMLSRDEHGSQSFSIQPYLVVHHADGSGFLDSFSYQCRIDTFTFLPATIHRDAYTNVYLWTIDSTRMTMPGFNTYIVGRTVQFQVISASAPMLLFRNVPAFLEPADNLVPAAGAFFTPPDTLRWHNNRVDVNITVEVWQGISKVWSKDTANVSKILLPGPLQAGTTYLWKVIARDISDNRAVAEATFTRP